MEHILDAPAHVPAIWGHGSEVLWAAGEGLMITGPPGVGKTTIMGQLALARAGVIEPELFGYPVEVDARSVLYMALDRPQQIRRSLRRSVTERHGPALAANLKVWCRWPTRSRAHSSAATKPRESRGRRSSSSPDPRTGEPLDKAAVLRRMRKALKAAELDQSHVFHDLRHTFGTAMAAAGVPMRTLQEWMGHRDIQTTQRYADYAPRARDAQLVASAFARGTDRGTDLSPSQVISTT